MLKITIHDTCQHSLTSPIRINVNGAWDHVAPVLQDNAVGNIKFAWDGRKARTNLVKHGVSFDEAQSVFLDENARLIDDPDHSGDEDRFLLLGYSVQARCLIVSHCYRESDSLIRLISARHATAQEEEVYWSLQ